jgi:hypothetical protein
MPFMGAEELLLAVKTTSDNAGLRAAKEGVTDLQNSVAGMSETSRAAFDKMTVAQQRQVLTFMTGAKVTKEMWKGAGEVAPKLKEVTAATDEMGAAVGRAHAKTTEFSEHGAHSLERLAEGFHRLGKGGLNGRGVYSVVSALTDLAGFVGPTGPLIVAAALTTQVFVHLFERWEKSIENAHKALDALAEVDMKGGAQALEAANRSAEREVARIRAEIEETRKKQAELIETTRKGAPVFSLFGQQGATSLKYLGGTSETTFNFLGKAIDGTERKASELNKRLKELGETAEELSHRRATEGLQQAASDADERVQSLRSQIKEAMNEEADARKTPGGGRLASEAVARERQLRKDLTQAINDQMTALGSLAAQTGENTDAEQHRVAVGQTQFDLDEKREASHLRFTKSLQDIKDATTNAAQAESIRLRLSREAAAIEAHTSPFEAQRAQVANAYADVMKDINALKAKGVDTTKAEAQAERVRRDALSEIDREQTKSYDAQIRQIGNADEQIQLRLAHESAYVQQVAQANAELAAQKLALKDMGYTETQRLDIEAALTKQTADRIQLIKEEADAARTVYQHQTDAMNAGTRGRVDEEYQTHLQQIQDELAADLRAGQDRVDAEARAQAKIRALRKDTAKAAQEDAKSITQVLLDSGSRQVKAVGHAAESIRRLIIGAQAAHAGVESAIEAGKALGSLAAGDFRGAALHGASALELAKAAALGAQESLGGGGGAGGGGGGGATDTGSFVPRTGTEGQGSLTINVLTQDPYGRTNIQQVMYELNRSEVLKRPPVVTVPPTTGVRAA